MAEFKGTKGSWRVDGHIGHQGIETMNVMQVNGGITVATINKFSPYEIPKEVLLTTRMHLTQKQVKDLIPILQKFVDTGELK
mgnify:CR=1 FL=1